MCALVGVSKHNAKNNTQLRNIMTYKRKLYSTPAASIIVPCDKSSQCTITLRGGAPYQYSRDETAKVIRAIRKEWFK